MYFTIYLITNKKNGKIYIGKHQTKNLDDGYMGSGKLIGASIKKYGLDNFTKSILFIFDNEEEMNAKEKELVSEEFCLSNGTYNLCIGGEGGFSYIRNNPKFKEWQLKAAKRRGEVAKERWNSGNLNSAQWWFTDEGLSKRRELSLKKLREKYKNGGWTFSNKKHSKETKELISQKAKDLMKDPTKNSQYGTMWITNGFDNKKIKKIDKIPEGWYKGRKMFKSS